jgi:hypothetical protein
MAQAADVELGRELSKFYADPLGFVMFSYPWGRPGTILEKHSGPDVWQREFLIQLGEEVRKRRFDGHTPVDPIRFATVSGHGVGKSTVSAWLTHWILSTRPHSRGTITANTFQQLSTRTWAQIQTWGKLCISAPKFTITNDQMYFAGARESWFVSAQSCKEENAENYAGQHAANSTSFYIFDESSAVPDSIFEVAEGGLTDGEPMIFLFGNPTRNSGKFWRVCFGSERNRWVTRSVDSRTSKLTNKKQIAEWLEDYGEDSDFFRVRVRGECPRAGTTQLIPSDVVAVCRKFQAQGYAALPKIISCDVARFGDDRTVIGVRQGRQFRILAKLRGVDTVGTTNRVIESIEKETPDAVVVDGDGLGASVVDQLNNRGFGHKLHEFHGGARPDDSDKYYNKRAEVWGLMADWLKAGAEIPDEAEMETDLTGPQYGYSNKSQIQLEKKEDMKARGMASPDLGDTLAMTFAVKVAAREKPVLKNLLYSFPAVNLRWMA